MTPPSSAGAPPAQFAPPELAHVLEFLAWAAAIFNAQGELWTHNHAWRQAPVQDEQHHPLGEGWELVLRREDSQPPLPKQGETPGSPNETHAEQLKLLTRGLTHELRNPLSAILTAIELLQDTPEMGEENAMLLDVVRKESRRISHILNEFSSYARPATSSADAFDFAHLARSAVAELGRDLNADAAFFELDDQLPGELWVIGDESQVRDALVRVLRNARDAMHANTRAGAPSLALTHETTARDGREHITLCVLDSGTGFTPEAARRAFEPFYSTKPHEAGLGLSIARGAMETAGGRLFIDQARAPHAGARLCFELPAAMPGMSAENQASSV